MAPPQLPGDAPVPTGATVGVRGLLILRPITPHRSNHTPDVVHPGMPRALMGLGQDSEVTPGHGCTGCLGHLPTAHVPLRPQQRLYHVLGPATGQTGKSQRSDPGSPHPLSSGAPGLTCKAAPPWGCPGHPGRVPALSGLPARPSWPQTWAGPGWERVIVTGTPRWPLPAPTAGSLTRKGGGTLTRAPWTSMMLMASSPCRCPTS